MFATCQHECRNDAQLTIGVVPFSARSGTATSRAGGMLLEGTASSISS
jgi:hypothetical protein